MTWCLTSTETIRLIRDGERGAGGGVEVGGEPGWLYTYRYTVTTRMTSALRWAAMRAILMFHNCEGHRQSPQTTSFDWLSRSERRAEADSNRGPSAYQPNALPLGQTSSHSDLSVLFRRATHGKPAAAFAKTEVTKTEKCRERSWKRRRRWMARKIEIRKRNIFLAVRRRQPWNYLNGPTLTSRK